MLNRVGVWRIKSVISSCYGGLPSRRRMKKPRLVRLLIYIDGWMEGLL
jgi:hypothetical protein